MKKRQACLAKSECHYFQLFIVISIKGLSLRCESWYPGNRQVISSRVVSIIWLYLTLELYVMLDDMGTWMYNVMWLLSWQYCIYQMWPQHGSMQKYKKKLMEQGLRLGLLTGLVWGSWHQLVKGHPLQYLIYIKITVHGSRSFLATNRKSVWNFWCFHGIHMRFSEQLLVQ